VVNNAFAQTWTKQGGYYNLHLYNFSPGKMTIDASNLAGNGPDFGPGYRRSALWQTKTIGPAGNRLQYVTSGVYSEPNPFNPSLIMSKKINYLNVNNFVNLRFTSIADKYVPLVAVANEKESMKLTNHKFPNFKTWFNDYWKSFSYATDAQKELRNRCFAPTNYLDYGGGQLYLSYIFNQLPDYEYNVAKFEELSNLHLMANAVPFEEGAVTETLDAQTTMVINADYKYTKPWKGTATLTNNASYPVYLTVSFSTKISGDTLFTFRDSFIGTGYAMERVGYPRSTGDLDTTPWMPAGGKIVIPYLLQPVYHFFGIGDYYENQVLNGDAKFDLCMKVTNITHSMGGTGFLQVKRNLQRPSPPGSPATRMPRIRQTFCPRCTASRTVLRRPLSAPAPAR
jgi:hypothetical protein